MPTAAEFDAAAAKFAAASRRLRSTGNRPGKSMGPNVLWGGVLTQSVDDVLRRVDTDAGAYANHLAQMADECRARAAATRAAAAAQAAYASQHAAYVGEVDAYNNAAAAAADAGEPFNDPAPSAPSPPPPPPGYAEF